MFLRLAVVLLALVIATHLFAGEPKELAQSRKEFEQAASRPNEEARSAYLTRLVRLRERLARNDDKAWQAVDAEMKRHPLPAGVDPKLLSLRLSGKWASPRHEYLYRSDGSWTMLPEEEEGQKSSGGRWRVEGNQLLQSDRTSPAAFTRYTILLVSKTDFVMTDGDVVFYHTRF
jgi:hypothetical protein